MDLKEESLKETELPRSTIDFSAIDQAEKESTFNPSLIKTEECPAGHVTDNSVLKNDLSADTDVVEEDSICHEIRDFNNVENNLIFTDSVSNMSMGADSRDNSLFIEYEQPHVLIENSCSIDPSIYIDEETRMFCNESPGINSPQDIVSPVDHGEVSSPFSAMESDGMETGFDDANLSAPGEVIRRPTGFFGASTPLDCTTTPGGSSSGGDDDYEESSGSRKKRRKTRREMQPSYITSNISSAYSQYSISQLPPSPSSEACCNEPDSSPFSPPVATLGGANFTFPSIADRRSSAGNFMADKNSTANPSVELISTSSNSQQKTSQHMCATAKEKQRGIDDASNDGKKLEKATRGNKKLLNISTPASVGPSSTTRRRHFTHHRVSASTGSVSDPLLHKQYPSKAEDCELKIISQPETQHRARYLTEGSRGPVKDSSQHGFPKVQLHGYDGPAVLQVFVGTDTGKVKPHGFYQACRVTGRNTSQCEELEIDGTKVIEIPFKSDDMILSVDCVGILKLRNTDVEARIGVRNQKRNQSVRLVFRVFFKRTANNDKDQEVVLQAVSVRINCTQPLGQPEIVKKSLDRSTVEGDVEMFIIGKNFHRGTVVIYQDPEEPDGSQWQAEGKVDKDTFNQTHMVVRIPPYHDLTITKPVNVQILVRYQGRSCEPHSFTYTPSQSQSFLCKDGIDNVYPISQPQVAGTMISVDNVSDNITEQENAMDAKLDSARAVKSLLDGPIDKKFLYALFSKLVTSVESNSNNPKSVMHVEGIEKQCSTASQIKVSENIKDQMTVETSMHAEANGLQNKQTKIDVQATAENLKMSLTNINEAFIGNNSSNSNVAAFPTLPTYPAEETVTLQVDSSKHCPPQIMVKSEIPILAENVWSNPPPSVKLAEPNMISVPHVLTSSNNSAFTSYFIPVQDVVAAPESIQKSNITTSLPLHEGKVMHVYDPATNCLPCAKNPSNTIMNQDSSKLMDCRILQSENISITSTAISPIVNESSKTVDPNSFVHGAIETFQGQISDRNQNCANMESCFVPLPTQSFTQLLPDACTFESLNKDLVPSSSVRGASSIISVPSQMEYLGKNEQGVVLNNKLPVQDIPISSNGMQHLPQVVHPSQPQNQTIFQPPALFQTNLVKTSEPMLVQMNETMVLSNNFPTLPTVEHIDGNEQITLHSSNQPNANFQSRPNHCGMNQDVITEPFTFGGQIFKNTSKSSVLTAPKLMQVSPAMNQYILSDSISTSIPACVNVQRISEMTPSMMETRTTGSNASSGLEHAPDFFAMDQLLQSIDGSENLATISGEDVQQQLL